MARGIQDLGNGLGYLYKTAINGTTIITTERNTVDGVRAMQQQGTANAPVVASRSAVGTITVDSVASAGDITAITIAAVNQIGANITVASSTASVVAAQIAAAINSFTPGSGDNYTAQAVDDVVYVFSSPANGSAANGESITVSVTDITIVTTTTDLANGSSQIGVYDTTFGYRFFIDADYSGTATPTSVASALEITEYMTVRGLQSGIITTDATVATDRLTGLGRACAITQIIVDTQASAATDILAFIETENFVEGDELRIRGADPSRVVTLEDATVTTSPIGTKNIYLTDATPFACSGYNSVTLQLRNDPTNGLCWIETGRSLANAVVSTTVTGLSALISARALKPGASYLITDIGDYGCYLFATDVDRYNECGLLLRRIPQGFTACWASNMAAPAVGAKYRYYQNVYTSVTGAVGTASGGALDVVNWTVVAKTNNTYYTTEAHMVGVNIITFLGAWPFIWERDLNNNLVSQSAWASGMGNAFNAFSWQVSGSTTVYGNTVIDSLFDCANSNGSVYKNTVLGGANFSSNTLGIGSVVASNLFNGTTVTGNFVTSIVGNNCNDGSITNNGASGAVFNQIAYCILEGGIITANTSTGAGAKSIEYCTVLKAGSITTNAFASTAKIRYTTVGVSAAIQNSTFLAPSGPSNIEYCQVINAATLQVVDTGTGENLKACVFEGGTTIIRTNGFELVDSIFRNSVIDWELNTGQSLKNCFDSCTMTFTGILVRATYNDVTTSGTPDFSHSDAIVMGNEFSNIEATLDLDDAGTFAAGVLTISSNNQLAGRFLLTATGNKNISEVANLPLFKECRFLVGSLFNFTFTTTGKATVAGDQIAGTAASFVLTAAATGAADELYMSKSFNINRITRTMILV